MSQFCEMRARRAARDLVDTVVGGFIALDEAGKEEAARRLNEFFESLAHSQSIRWQLSQGG